MPTLRKKSKESEGQKPADDGFVYSEEEDSDGVNSNPATQNLAKAQREREQRLKEESRPPKPQQRLGLLRNPEPKEKTPETESSSPPPQDSGSWREHAPARSESPYSSQGSTLARSRSQRRSQSPAEERAQGSLSEEAELAADQYRIFKSDDARDPEAK